MNESPQYLEILAIAFGLGGLTILSITMVRRMRATRRIDPREQRQIAWQTILGMFAFGICMALTGLSLSLWSPAGLERLTFREGLLSFLLCGGGSAMVGIFLVIIDRWKIALRRKWGIDTDQKWRGASRNRQIRK